jgi:23S rRNA (uracil1939-C5)-methyltransferase
VLRAERLVGGGSAIAHLDGATWMVRGALPGETVSAGVVDRRAGIVEAEVEELVADPHPARWHEVCPHAADCGGCDWPHVEPAAGAALKSQVAAGAARPFPAIADQLARAPVHPSPLAYRLRARLHWDPVGQRLGFYARRSWRVIDIPECRILSPRLMAARQALAEALGATCPARVDLEWLEDLAGESALIGLRPARQGPPHLEPSWLPPAGALDAVVRGARLLSRSGRAHNGWGADSVTMALPVALEVPIGAFFQVNRFLVPWLFDRVRELSGEQPLPAWDLHAGVGLLAAAAQSAAERRLTVTETFGPAARAAASNLPQARVSARAAESYLSRRRHLPGEALALVDPPRCGMSRALRRALVGWRPRRVLSLGCDPATWARDADELCRAGFRLAHLELVDLFPSTHHVEILALLERS